jgi:hypothetical protein
MKIVPIDSSGEPVEVLKANWDNGIWNLIVSCHSEQHNLTLERDKQLTIHDHPSEEITAEETMAELAGTPGAARPCVRVRLWLSTGIYLINVIP